MLCVRSIVFVALIVLCSAFLEDDAQGSCKGRCDSRVDHNKPCQCNDHCARFNDCCPDYNFLCTDDGPSNCPSFTAVAQALWDNDVNRMSQAEVSVNYQSQVPDHTNDDKSSQRLFSHVNEAKFNTPTYRAFLALIDNYDHNYGHAEHVTSQERQEESTFLDAIFNTQVMHTLEAYLKCTKKITTRAELRQLLTTLWFDLYPRSGSSTIPDTSGFEHLMVGEWRSSSKVSGFHNWITFYTYEKKGSLNYYGYVNKKSIGGNLGAIGAAFNWSGRLKTLGSFFIGTSPEFDLAIYSLCFIQYPGRKCDFTLENESFTIQTYEKDHDGNLATAFVNF